MTAVMQRAPSWVMACMVAELWGSEPTHELEEMERCNGAGAGGTESTNNLKGCRAAGAGGAPGGMGARLYK